MVDVKIFSSGFCKANNKFVHPGALEEKIKFEATWALIEHPSLGNILFDTGYTTRFFEGTKSFPARIYRWVTPVYLKKGQSCREILPAHLKIDHIVLSHFHADHTGGLKDFPKTKIWCHHEELKFALSRNSLNGFKNGILTNQIPNDISARAQHPEFELEPVELSGLTGWQWTEDMFFVYLPGHSIGQLGLLIRNSTKGDIMLCADACWSAYALRNRIYPSKLVSLFVSSYPRLVMTMNDLYEFTQTNPEVKILPTHCPETSKLVDK